MTLILKIMKFTSCQFFYYFSLHIGPTMASWLLFLVPGPVFASPALKVSQFAEVSNVHLEEFTSFLNILDPLLYLTLLFQIKFVRPRCWLRRWTPTARTCSSPYLQLTRWTTSSAMTSFRYFSNFGYILSITYICIFT